MTSDDVAYREKIRDRIRRRRPGISSQQMAVTARALQLLLQDADEATALRAEVAWYRARLERGAWMPDGMPLPTDPPEPPPSGDTRPRMVL